MAIKAQSSNQVTKITVKQSRQNLPIELGQSAQHFNNLSELWATSPNIVENKDYSSKYYAEISKQKAQEATEQAEAGEAILNELNDNKETLLEEINTTAETCINSLQEEKNNCTIQIINTAQETTNEINNVKNNAVTQLSKEAQEQLKNIESTGFYMRDNKLYFINSEGEEEEFKSGGGGIDIGYVGFTQMAIDESKGKKRKLNGQIIVQEQFQQLTNILKASIAQNPDMACTEQEWQAEVTMSTTGICYKFVVDDEGGTIRLPKYPDYFIGGVNDIAPVVGNGQVLGLMDGKGGYYGLSGYTQSSVNTVSAEAYGKGLPVWCQNLGTQANLGVTNDPTKSGIEAQIKQEQIKGTYFIQVATGSETEDNIINTLELNNPFVLLEPKFFETEVYNVSWLRSNGQYNSSAIYPSAYQALLVENNAEIEVGSTVTLPIGTEYTKRGLSVKEKNPIPTSVTKTISATNGWSNANNAFDGNIETYASCGTSTDYIEVEYSEPVNIKGFTATGYWVDSVSRACNVAIYSVDENNNETLLANGTGASSSANYTTNAIFAQVQINKLRFKLINASNGNPPTTQYPTRIREIFLDVVDTVAYTDYDYVINTTDETFRLPIKVNLASGKAVVGNGMTLGLLGNANNYGGLSTTGSTYASIRANSYGKELGTTATGPSSSADVTFGVTPDPDKSGLELSDSNLYLYFYIGETVQNANLVNVGRVIDGLAQKLDSNKAIYWESDEFSSTTYNTLFTFNHNLNLTSNQLKRVKTEVVAVCKNANYGWTAGEIAPTTVQSNSTVSIATTSKLTQNSISFFHPRVGSNASIQVMNNNGTNQTYTSVNNSNWNLKIRLWCIGD